MPPAIIGAAIVGGSGLASAAISGSASQNAAQTQATAEQSAANTQEQMYEQTAARLGPFVGVGTDAAGTLANMQPFTNPGGTFNFQPTEAQLEATPGYQFNLNQGLKATQNSYAAQGLGTSGAAEKGAASYASGLADSTYQNQFTNALNSYQTNYNTALGAYNTNVGVQQNLASLGENAAANTGNFATTTAANIGQTAVGAANATAAGTVGAANATSAGIGSLANAYLYGTNQFNQPASIYGGVNTNVKPDASGYYDGGGSDY